MTEVIHTGTLVLYAGFTLLVIGLLAVDFLLLRTQGSHKVSMKEAAWWSVVWFLAAAAFGTWFWWHLNARFGADTAAQKTLEYATVYSCRKCLSVVTEKICPHPPSDQIQFSGTKIRDMLLRGEYPSPELVRPEVAKVIMDFQNPFNE